jgi:hypothetical protein
MVWAVVSLDPKCSLLMACLRTLEHFENSHLVSLFFFFFVGRIFWHLFPLLFLSVFFHFFFLFTRRLETVLQEINGDSMPNGTIDCCLFALFSHIKVLFFLYFSDFLIGKKVVNGSEINRNGLTYALSFRPAVFYVIPLIPCLTYSVYFGGFLTQFLIEKMGMMGAVPPPYG